MRSRHLVAAIFTTFLGTNVFAQVATFDFQNNKVIDVPVLRSRDTVTVRLTGINPISHEYTINLTEVDPFKFVQGLIPDWVKPFLPGGQVMLGFDGRSVSKTIDDTNQVIKEIRLFPMTASAVRGTDQLTKQIDALELRLTSGGLLELVSTIRRRDKSSDTLAMASVDRIAAANEAALNQAKERIKQYREIIAGTYEKTLEQKESGLFGKFIEGTVEEKPSKRWNDDLGALKAEANCAENPCLDANEKAAVDAYLAGKTEKKNFRLRVEPVLPVDLTLGYAWSGVERIEYDTAVDPTSGHTIIARTKNEQSTDYPLVFASHSISPAFKGWKLHLGAGTNIDDPGRIRSVGLGFTFNERFLAIVGWSRGKTHQLLGDQEENAVVPAGTKVTTREEDSDGLFLGFSVHLNQ